MMFEYDRRAERWSVSHDQEESWQTIPDVPSKYLRRYKKYSTRKDDHDEDHTP